MSRVTHGACGRSWKQKGEKSGHCGNCHETYYGLTAFDRHRTHYGDGTRSTCIDPSTGDRGPWWQDDDGQWHHGTRLTDEQKRERGWLPA